MEWKNIAMRQHFNILGMLYFRVLLDRQLQNYPSVLEFCQQLYDDRYRSPYLMAYMIDTYEEMLEQGCDKKEETLKKADEVKIYCLQ